MTSLECRECAVSVAGADVIICYGGCGGVFCVKCTRLKKAETKVITENVNIRWCCNECSVSDTNAKFIELKHLIDKMNESRLKTNDIKELIRDSMNAEYRKMKMDILAEISKTMEQKMESEHAKLKNELWCGLGEKMEKQMSNINKMSETDKKKKLSYAQMVRSNENKIVVKSKNKEKGNREIRETLKTVMEPTQELIRTVKEINNGGLIIECGDQQSRQQIERELNEKMGEDFEVEKIKDIRNKGVFKIIGMNENLDEDRIITCIKKQNDIFNEKEIKIVKIYENKNTRRESYNIIVETDRETCEKIIEKKRIKIEWSFLRVFECESVMRCYKCLGFRHKAQECTNKKACGKCAGSHEMKECTSEEINCVNCLELVKKKKITGETNHYAFSRACPAFRHQLVAKRKKAE